MDLYNTRTRQKEPIDDSASLQQAILSGSHSFPAGTNVIVYDPNGEPGKVPSENLGEAIRAGFLVETPRQRVIREYKEDNAGILGSVKVGLSQFADETLFGLPELIYDKTQDPLEVAKKEALKKEHALANALGGLAGFGASMFTGGPLWKAATKAGEKVSTHLAQKLAVEAGEEVGKRTLNKAAKEIVARMGGTAAEGAVATLPYAITEAALGDPEQAAETMLSGVGLGAMFGGATGLGKEFLGLGKKVANESARLVGERDLTLKSLARRAAKVVTGVDEDDILYYMKNSEKVNKAPSVEALKDQIDDIVRQKMDDVTINKENLKNVDFELRQAYSNARRDLSQARAPQELADDLVAAMVNEKEVLGNMSRQADDILERVDGTVSKEELKSFISKVKQDVVPVQIGKKSVQTARDLDSLAMRIDEQLPNDITFPQVREVLQQVRNDIDWNTLSSEFNTQSNKAIKSFQKSVSNLIKDKSPEYAEQMAAMAERSKSLEEMNRLFGDRERAASTLNRILKPGGEVRSEALDRFSSITGTNFSEELNNLRRSKELLERSAREDISQELVPNLFQRREDLRNQLQRAEEALRPLSKLTPDRTQNAIRNMGRKDANISIRRAFEALEEATGTPFLEQIKDRHVYDAFQKASTQGSRKTNLMGAIGFASAGGLAGLGAGGPVGAAAGALAGATMDVYGGQLLKSLIDRTPNVAGLLFTEKAMKRAAEKIDDIPNLLREATRPKISKSTIAIEGLWRLLDPEAKPNLNSREDATKQIEKIDEKVRTYLIDNNSFENMMGRFTYPLAEGGAPQISQALSVGTRRALQYLYAQVPKQPAPSSPFAPKIEWQPSDYEINTFAQTVQVAQNPFSVLDEFQNGTLTNNHMQALRTMFPSVAQMIQNKIFDFASSGDQEPLTYDQRLSLSLLAGVPLDSSLEGNNILNLQKRFLQGEDQPADQQQQTFVPKRNINIAQNSATTLQAAQRR